MAFSTTAATTLRALVPGSLIDARATGAVRGIYHAETGVLNVLAPGTPHAERAREVGRIYPTLADAPAWARDLDRRTRPASKQDLLALIKGAGPAEEEADAPHVDDAPVAHEEPQGFCLYWTDTAEPELVCVGPGGRYAVERYDLHRDVFSRNTGILETDLMAAKRVAVLGCGSVGSLVVLELARAGVGNFLLVDADIFEYHNICRHQCGVEDVGRYKVDAVRDRILAINPCAHVETARTTAEQVAKDVFDRWIVPGETLLMGCADGRAADAYGNSIAVLYQVPYLSIGFWERAFAGEIFYWLPGRREPCYRCALGAGEDGISQRVEANHHIYSDQADLAAVNFEPGISIDINFVTIIGIKLALDILNEGNPRFTQRLLPHLTQYTLVCNTNDPAVGGEMAEIFSYPLQVTTSLMVGFRDGCPPCTYERGA